MKVAVVGLWHLGLVTAASLASVGHSVIGFDDKDLIESLKRGKTPIFEPGLNDLLAQDQQQGFLSYTYDPKDLSEAEIVWITYDTPVDDDDQADTQFVFNQIQNILPCLKDGALMIVSSQLPVGSIAQLRSWAAAHFPNQDIHFACSPENLRLGKALDVFLKPDRVIVGLENPADEAKVRQLFSKITDQIIFMSVASAEMTKHAINAFLATSVVFINDIARLCESVGADAQEVERGLKSESRIGPKAYLKPGAAFAGGTLARDVSYLIQIAKKNDIEARLFPAILSSNEDNKFWAGKYLERLWGSVKDKKITLLGLTYKPGTNTLRRSAAIELARWFHHHGAIVTAYDPMITAPPAELKDLMTIKSNAKEALMGAEAAVVCTEWPEFKEITPTLLKATMQKKLVCDVNGFCEKVLGHDADIAYYRIGEKP